MTICASRTSPDHVDDGGERGGVAGVAVRPGPRQGGLLVGEQPDSTAVRLPAVPEKPRGASGQATLHPRRRQPKSATRAGLGLGPRWRGPARLDRVLPVLQPVHRGVDVIGGRPGHAEVGAQGGVTPPGQGGQLRAGRTTGEMIRARARSRCPRAEQRGAPASGHGVHGGDVAVRQRVEGAAQTPGSAPRTWASRWRRDDVLGLDRPGSWQPHDSGKMTEQRSC